MDLILSKDEKHKVVGEIYKITNLVNNKSYIGQTRSHRLNHNKYRPFGYLGRFKDHFSEANSNKKNQSRYLNFALLKYGYDNFTCERIQICKVEELDYYEKHHIELNDTLYPNGYNLTKGGKTFTCVNGKYEWKNVRPLKVDRNFKRSEYTKSLISKQLKKFYDKNQNDCLNLMKRTQKQHLNKKYEKFKDLVIDFDRIDDYIRIRNNKNGKYVIVKINNKQTSFVGKYETIDEIKQRAKEFLFSLRDWQRDQIAGNSLELQTTTL